ncbi:hypothetical protein JOQ06_006487 [Pogonophryne albipinna]|uniref:Nuclear pore complex NUP2/50/61 domain-containing protein n=1 Tax=Pogonophryne albipinna TaxID=1090488 RepID=A0AAD6ADG1_9TELE|nr:hypothetical protein JOQ06_006487 [Pogonophryne albipinna]
MSVSLTPDTSSSSRPFWTQHALPFVEASCGREDDPRCVQERQAAWVLPVLTDGLARGSPPNKTHVQLKANLSELQILTSNEKTPVPVWQEVLMVLVVLDLETGHLLHHFPPRHPHRSPSLHHSLSLEGFPTSVPIFLRMRNKMLRAARTHADMHAIAGGMAKRIADKELTDRNWDQEEEGEEAGTFLVATEDVLKSRAIKKAKRRNIGEAESGGSSFKGFKGFSLTPAPGGEPAPTGFSGFGNGGGGFTGLSGSTNGSSSTPAFTGFFSPASTATTPGLTFSSDRAAFSAPKTEAARPTGENGEEETDEPPKVDVKEDDAFYSKK